jgi:hypothetical protein
MLNGAELKLLIAFLQALAAAPPANAAVPRQPPTISMQSLGEVADAVIRCYHPTGRVQSVNVIQSPWDQQQVWKGSASAVLRIQWRGAIKSYVSAIALVERDSKVHAAVLRENSLVPASKRCALDGWAATTK